MLNANSKYTTLLSLLQQKHRAMIMHSMVSWAAVGGTYRQHCPRLLTNFLFYAFTLWQLSGHAAPLVVHVQMGHQHSVSDSWVLGAGCRVDDQLRVPRGSQRAIGAMMLTTPSGSDRHYTMDFAQFCERYSKDPFFAEWLKPSHDDIINLATGATWKGQGPFPMG